MNRFNLGLDLENIKLKNVVILVIKNIYLYCIMV